MLRCSRFSPLQKNVRDRQRWTSATNSELSSQATRGLNLLHRPGLESEQAQQRMGRLDRIGALAEREKKSIVAFEPYLAGTQDEKVFRVAKDRAGWVGIVMGRVISGDEYTTDVEDIRIPLHPRIRKALSMDLTSR
ncbi:hypothetical protein GS504_28370 [Rhodococcus hoagii]|uniref:hypothetical protein n=1 Tax=Rhodococcus hoagii TaxID=43767 RepID=UPI0011A11F45|nr:hypothetical protein [Prescottella equi]NKR29282.1 hypothetical protein [Prescottella equi]NKS61380.1 hypothetical protein [Prescottella equi]NKS70573.1 hypothetical protein [Prescottella equi]